jgi:hypothetical protein
VQIVNKQGCFCSSDFLATYNQSSELRDIASQLCSIDSKCAPAEESAMGPVCTMPQLMELSKSPADTMIKLMLEAPLCGKCILGCSKQKNQACFIGCVTGVIAAEPTMPEASGSGSGSGAASDLSSSICETAADLSADEKYTDRNSGDVTRCGDADSYCKRNTCAGSREELVAWFKSSTNCCAASASSSASSSSSACTMEQLASVSNAANPTAGVMAMMGSAPACATCLIACSGKTGDAMKACAHACAGHVEDGTMKGMASGAAQGSGTQAPLPAELPSRRPTEAPMPPTPAEATKKPVPMVQMSQSTSQRCLTPILTMTILVLAQGASMLI